VVGTYYTCRNVLEAAGIPCNFGKDGQPTTDAGMGRDPADCLDSLVCRLSDAERERDAFKAALIEAGREPCNRSVNAAGWWNEDGLARRIRAIKALTDHRFGN
jgi:hypothetical protein